MSQNEIENIAINIKQPLTKKGEMTKKKLLDTAEEIFGTKGYFQASIVDITQQADVAQGTFYKYFTSKYEIFEVLVKQLSSDFRKEIRLKVDLAKSEREAQILGFKAFFEWVKNHRHLYSIVQQAILVNEDLYRWYYERLAEGYIKGLQRAMEHGEFKDLNPETVAYCLMGMTQFIGMRWVYWGEKEVPEQVFHDAIELIFNGLRK